MILGPVKLTVNVNGHPGLILGHCKEQASEQAAYVGKLSQGRGRDSHKKGGKPWLKQPAAGNKSQGGEAVECTSSLPHEVQKRGRLFIFWLPPLPAAPRTHPHLPAQHLLWTSSSASQASRSNSAERSLSAALISLPVAGPL